MTRGTPLNSLHPACIDGAETRVSRGNSRTHVVLLIPPQMYIDHGSPLNKQDQRGVRRRLNEANWIV